MMYMHGSFRPILTLIMLLSRLEPIMLLKLPVIFLSSAPKLSLCSKLCSEIQIMLIGTVKFNTLKYNILL